MRACTVSLSVLILGVIGTVFLAGPVSAAYPETRIYTLGDIDGLTYQGPGSVDDVYVDPGWYAWSEEQIASYNNGVDDFDVLLADHAVPFTFLFNLGDGEEVVGASLTLGLRATSSGVTTDVIHLDAEGPTHSYWFSTLDWLPVADTGVSVRAVDLAQDYPNTRGDHTGNMLPLLQDGKFDVMVADDCAIDYAILTVQVTPEPCTLVLLALGGAAMVIRRCRRSAPGT